MRKLIILIISAFIVNIYTSAQTVGPKYLEDKEVTRLVPTPVFQKAIGLDPKLYRVMVSTLSYDKKKYWIWLVNNETGMTSYFGINRDNPTDIDGPYIDYKRIVPTNYIKDENDYWVENTDAICWGLSTDSYGNLVFAATRQKGNWDGTEKTNSDIHPISEILFYDNNIKWSWSVVLTPAQIEEIYNQVGAPRYFEAYGDLYNSGNGYIVWTGAWTSDTDPKYTPTGKMVKLNCKNRKLESIEYFSIPEGNDNTEIHAYSDNQIVLQVRSNTIGLFDFSKVNADGTKGGFIDNFIIEQGTEGNTEVKEGRGFNLSNLGFCYFKMQGKLSTEQRDIFMFPTGSNYTEQFTGYDITNYHRIETVDPDGNKTVSADYSDCYYYAPGVSPSGVKRCNTGTAINNFLLYIPSTDPSVGHILQYHPNVGQPYTGNAETMTGNVIRCYKVEILPREDVFKQPAQGMTANCNFATEYNEKLKCDELAYLTGNVEFKDATIPTTHSNLGDQLTIVDYRASIYENDGKGGYANDPSQTLVNASNNNFTFIGLKQPLNDAKGGTIYDKNYAAKGDYKVQGHVHYQWYGQVNFRSQYYDGTIAPNYNSASAVSKNYKNIWVKGRPYDGGQNVNPSMLYVPINFDPAPGIVPVSVYRVKAINKATNDTVIVADVPGNYNFNDRDNVNKHEGIGSGMPPAPGESMDFPFVCYFSVPCPSESQAATIAANYTYEIETIYGLNYHKVRRSYVAVPTTAHSGIVTGVETVDENRGFSVTPTLVENLLNVTCGEGIRNIDVYSLSGSLIKHVEGNGNTFESVIVDDLAAGTYFVKVNNTKVVKIVKK